MSFGPSPGAGGLFDLSRPQPFSLEPPAAKSPLESVPAAQPGGIDLPFDPRAKDDLPFNLTLPDDTRSPFPLDLPAREPLPFELPQAEPALPEAMPAAASDMPGFFGGPPPAEQLPEAEPAPLDVAEEPAEPLFHIPCPSGHRLELTRDMLGKEAICPYCQKPFMLNVERSVEYQQQRAQRVAKEEMKLGRIWLNAAIVAAVLVVAALLILLYSLGKS
jgi:hypothetical protein